MKRQASSTYKQPPAKRQKKNASSDLSTLKTKVRKLEKQVEVKTQIFQYAATPVAVNYLANATLGCCNIAQGTSEITRIGNKICAKRLKVRIYVSPGTVPTYRVIVLNDKMCIGAAALAVDVLNNNDFSVLSDGGAGITGVIPVQCWTHNHDVSPSRFYIYRDVVNSYVSNDNLDKRFVEFDIPLKNLIVEYVNTTASNTSIFRNQLQISVSQTTTTPGGTGQPTVIQAELEFTDV